MKKEKMKVQSLTIVEQGGQVRQKGLVANKVKQLVRSIESFGLLKPITVDEEGVVIDGNHRVEAHLQLMKTFPQDKKYTLIDAYVKKFNSDLEKIQYQMLRNSHPPASDSSSEDWRAVITKCIKSGLVQGVQWETLNKDEKNHKVLMKWVNETFIDNNKKPLIHHSTLKSVVDSIFKKAPDAKLKNYGGSDGLLAHFSEYGPISWQKTKQGYKCDDQYVCQIGDEAHLAPNVSGHAYNAKTSYPGVKVNLVAYKSNTTGLTGAGLDQYRKGIVERMNNYNDSFLLAEGQRLIDKIYFAPQKLDDTEDLGKYFEVEINQEGAFDKESIPTAGW